MGSHRSTLKQKNKPHKSGHSQRPKFKTISSGVPGPAPTPEQGQKNRRMQQAEAIRQNKNAAFAEQRSIGTKNGPPKVVGFLPSSENADTDGFISALNFKPENEEFFPPSGILQEGQFINKIIPISIARSIEAVIDVGKVADVIVLVFAAGEPLDSWGAQALKILKSIGLPNVMAVVHAPDGRNIDRAMLVNYRNYIQKDLPDVDRILPYSFGNEQHYAQFVRFLANEAPSPISWKTNRPLILIQKYVPDPETKTVELTGYLRNAPLSPNQLLTIGGLGDYSILEVNGFQSDPALKHEFIYSPRDNEEILDDEIGVPHTDEISNEVALAQEALSRLDLDMQKPFEADSDENNPEIEEESLLFKRNPDELEFPDEFDYNETVLLQQRLQKYRGLQSFKKSPWNVNESLPPQYQDIFEFTTYKRTQEKVINEQLAAEVKQGQQVVIRIAANGDSVDEFNSVPFGRLVIAFGLFRHETKYSVVNATIHNIGEPFKSKTEIVAICGHRNLWITPMFSENTRGDKHLFRRGILHDEHAVATFIAPAFMQMCPVTYFRMVDGGLEFVGTGSIISVDHRRMIIKRIILTGNPYRTSGPHARVTMMFFNRSDVYYFRNIDLYTKKKLKGHINEPIGEKGRFKATFNDVVGQDDTIAMRLYKRVFPPLNVAPIIFS